MTAPPTVAVLRGHTGFDPDYIPYQARRFNVGSWLRHISTQGWPAHLKCDVCSRPATVEVNCRSATTDADDWAPSCDACALPPLACAWPGGCPDMAYFVRPTPEGHFPACTKHASSGEHYSIVEPFYRRYNAWVAS